MYKIPLELLKKMRSPGEYRQSVWGRDRVFQIKITNACDLDCKNCSVGVGIARKLKKIFTMSIDEFRQALQSLKGFTGVIGVFGGNPCIHPKFEEICSIFREEFPNKDQRGLWSNRLFGHGKTCRETFGQYSNLNVHQSKEAWDEIKKDWPEGRAIWDGLVTKSSHGPIFGSMLDLGISENEMWEKVSKCYVNQSWSPEITVVSGKLLGYFCEIAATMAELTDDPSQGILVSPGWWNKDMLCYQEQVNTYCSKCLVPLNPRKIDAAGNEQEEYTQVWKRVFMTIKGRNLKQVTSLQEIHGGEPATKYLPSGVF